MKPTQNEMADQLADRLRTLTRDFRFRWGQPTSCSDGVVDVSIDRDWDEEGQVEHLVTVFAGFPPRPEVEGLTLTLQRADAASPPLGFKTDRRGQVRLQGLEPAEYRLSFKSDVFKVDPGVFRAAAKDAQTRLVQHFHSADGKI